MNKFRAVQRASTLGKIAVSARRAATAPKAQQEDARRALALLLADARGVPLKIGQFLANRSEDTIFQEQIFSPQARSLDEILPSLEEALGTSMDSHFGSLEASEHAASLGQVHRARLHSGEDVAVKIQYPDIRSQVNTELQLAGLMPAAGPVRKWGFDLNAYKNMLREDLDRELDYTIEAKNQIVYRSTMAPITGLVVPKVFDAYTTKETLVQEWCSGLPLTAAASWPTEDRRALGEVLLKTLLYSFFVGGLVHADPHLGNLSVRKGNNYPELVLMDYGCMCTIPKRIRLALLKLIIAAQERDTTDPLECFVEAGFDAHKLAPIANVLPALSSVLFEPFTQNGVFSHRQWELGKRIEALLGDFKWWFRSAGPAELFFMMRAFSGLILHLNTLKIALPWRAVLEQCIPENMWNEARNFQPTPVPQNQVERATRFNTMAEALRIEVRQGNETLVKVAMPANQVAQLDALVPEDIHEKIIAEGIDLHAIARDVCARGIVAEELFNTEKDGKQYRVWLD